MFEDDVFVNKIEKLSYKVDVYEMVDFNLVEEDYVFIILEIIIFIYDFVVDVYIFDKVLLVVDLLVFGVGYIVVYFVIYVEDGLIEIIVDIVVGVLFLRFENVKNCYVDELVFVDLLGDVIVNDGYGNDKIGDIKIIVFVGFNIYNLKLGIYKIDLEFIYYVYIVGEFIVLDRIIFGSKVIDVIRKN